MATAIHSTILTSWHGDWRDNFSCYIFHIVFPCYIFHIIFDVPFLKDKNLVFFMAIISASRRTDLPAFYIKETVEAFKKGSIDLVNPFNKKPFSVSLKHDDVSCIVWWSKDYSNYLLAGDEARSILDQHHQIFQFTINGYRDKRMQAILEPGVRVDLDARIRQAALLAELYSPRQVSWRFDPIATWMDDKNEKHDSLGDLEYISQRLGIIKIERCFIAFADLYKKSLRRASTRFGKRYTFYKPSIDERKRISAEISLVNKKNGIKTFSCAHDDIIDVEKNVFKATCIDGMLINDLFGTSVSVVKDTGQREECGCAVSKDIGRYDQRCFHSCTLCYANPDDK